MRDKRLPRQFHTVKHDWLDGNHGDLIRESSQEITQYFMDEIELLRKLQAARGRIGEYLHVLRVPRIIHEKWVREGFDPTTASEDDIHAQMERLNEMKTRLKRDGMDKFILTNKTF